MNDLALLLLTAIVLALGLSLLLVIQSLHTVIRSVARLRHEAITDRDVVQLDIVDAREGLYEIIQRTAQEVDA